MQGIAHQTEEDSVGYGTAGHAETRQSHFLQAAAGSQFNDKLDSFFSFFCNLPASPFSKHSISVTPRFRFRESRKKGRKRHQANIRTITPKRRSL